MTNEKSALIEQMEKQRFLPITEETFHLYQSYAALIDKHDPDELSYLLFYEGEYFFRIGDFNQALSSLTRCLQAPKRASLQFLDACSYSIIGLIYSYLGQETIAISHLLQAKHISTKAGLARESAVCCANLGLIYSQLEVYDVALGYYNEAINYTSTATNQAYNLAVLCHAYRGILFCRTGAYEKALNDYQQIKVLLQENTKIFYDASVINLSIRLYDVHKDDAALQSDLAQLTKLVSSHMDFLEMSEFYFDVCDYLLARELGEECALVLNYIKPYCMESPLIFPRYRYLKYQAAYSRYFSDERDYQQYCSEVISLHTRYEEEQNQAKLYSLEFVERLRQTKNDSEMYHEKSRIDQMTGLLNKYTIQFLIEEDLSKSASTKQSALILVDMDHFKQINDTLGHLAGDSFICQTASIIQNYFKDTALCGRVGGDEFLVYISDASDRSFILLQTEILRQEIYRQTSERNITITTQASIGIAFSSEYRYNYESLFSAADSALYRAKLEGRNKVVVAE